MRTIDQQGGSGNRHQFGRRATLRASLLGATMLAGAMAAPALAQDEEDTTEGDVVVVTGTRIQAPNVVAASPINTIGLDEINRQFTPNIERVFRDLPITIPGDGENVNNGTEGAASIDLRGLGPERSLVMIDGKRMVPYNQNGIVDINTIPLNMIERVDIITGGASAVYGSDALSGAVNFILRKDFEGVEFDAGFSTTEDGGGDTYDISGLMGANFADGRGNVALSLNYTRRNGVLLSQRDYGVFGVNSSTGDGLGAEPTAPPPECDAPFATADSGSTTAIPGAIDLISGTIQFRNDGSVGPRCSVHNFNPFNYYQTPQERFGITAVGSYEINDAVEVYARGTFAGVNVRQQVAPSGVFGNQFAIPLQNPFLTDGTRAAILNNVNTFLAANPSVTFAQAGINDLNSNGVFDINDSITAPVRRRTLELGTRSEDYDNNLLQILLGVRGEVAEGWTYDVSFQHAETDRTTTRAGYTNVANIATALNTVSAVTCTSPTGVTTQGCVPIDIFGGFGSITPEAAAYASATAFQTQNAKQTIVHASMSGELDNFKSPWASNPFALAFGLEYREESGALNPDECLKLPPVSCQGGAGGNLLPISAQYHVWEGFAEGIWPIIEGRPMFENLSLEAGYRYSAFNPTGSTDSWKLGLSWEVVPGLRFRYMEQQAVRAPNVAEIGSPITTGLDNASFDPCSSGNPNPISPELEALCIATGVPSALVGSINDIVSGQVNVFVGTNLADLPDPETARTRTAGVVWQPDMSSFGDSIERTTLSIDYYDINIKDYIDAFTGQEALDACYVFADASACAGVVRSPGGLITTAGTGVTTLTTNLDFFRASGIEVGLQTGYDFGQLGVVALAFNANRYLKNEFKSSEFADVRDCNGFYGTSCDPVPTLRTTARATWINGPFETSVLWRRIGAMDLQENERDDVFDAFESISAFNYLDFSAGYQINENVRIGGIVKNLTGKEPPIIGNETGTTDFNSGNTFPSIYDALGRTYAINIKATF